MGIICLCLASMFCDQKWHLGTRRVLAKVDYSSSDRERERMRERFLFVNRGFTWPCLSLPLCCPVSAPDKIHPNTDSVQFHTRAHNLKFYGFLFVSSDRSSYSDVVLSYIRGGGSNFFRFSLRPLMQLMLQESL